ncbi:hypothetical protein V1514DRAFT_359470 [Lipomyces japonicus]|uniref:uncharacterized protein n=1 Tax=Lipomyces japonicus TaxID=56871 RepID=UPI0034CD15EB
MGIPESPAFVTSTARAASVRSYASIISPSEHSSLIDDQSPLLDSALDDPVLEPIVRPKSRFWRFINFLRGPSPPRPSSVSLIYPPVQLFPFKLGRSLKKSAKIIIIVFYLASWFLIFLFLSRKSKFTSVVSTNDDVLLLECGQNPLWMTNTYHDCGVDAGWCAPFENTSISFRCPSSCGGASKYSMTTVGSENVIYKPYVIGDETGYRADSYICAAAVHAGVISEITGGCGKVVLDSSRDYFPASTSHGVQSLEFNSYFPASFVFDTQVTGENCADLRWTITGVNIVLSAIFAYFVYSPSVFFWGMFMMGFWSIVLASDPPPTNLYPNPGAEVVSVAFERLLPTAFIGYVIFQVAVRPQQKNFRAQATKAFLWVGAFWVGSLNNYTFDQLPLDRFVLEDIQNLPGGIAAITFVLLTIFVCACGQAYIIWKNNQFFPYLFGYFIVMMTLIGMALVPEETLRIHHYILGLLILPATAFQTSLSVLYQGLAVGMFLNGATRWGYDSILQTPYQLSRGGPQDTSLAMFTTNSTNFNGEWVNWTYPAYPTDEANYTGFSLLINDVERYRGPDMNISLTWFFNSTELQEQRYEYDWYFRIGMYTDEGEFSDYTRAGIAQKYNGSWVDPQPGPS